MKTLQHCPAGAVAVPYQAHPGTWQAAKPTVVTDVAAGLPAGQRTAACSSSTHYVGVLSRPTRGVLAEPWGCTNPPQSRHTAQHTGRCGSCRGPFDLCPTLRHPGRCFHCHRSTLHSGRCFLVLLHLQSPCRQIMMCQAAISRQQGFQGSSHLKQPPCCCCGLKVAVQVAAPGLETIVTLVKIG